MYTSEIRNLRTFCHAHRDWLCDTIEAIVKLESPSTDKRAVDHLGDELAKRLITLGAHVSRPRQAICGDQIVAQFGTRGPQVLLLGHIDTVWPVGQIERMPVVRNGGRLYGPGVLDMKAGIAIGMLAIRAVLECQTQISSRITMLLTTDEEIGSIMSRQIVEDQARQSEAVFVLEPAGAGGALKTRRKGCREYVLTVRGVCAHAGHDPAAGASAIHELATQICAIGRLTNVVTGLSVNVGRIDGGTRGNVVAEEAQAVINIRYVNKEDGERVDEEIRGLIASDSRITLGISGGLERPPMNRTKGVAKLYERARQIALIFDDDLREEMTGGGSDGNFTAALEIPTLDGLGAIGEGAHAMHESVTIDALPDRAALVAGLIAGSLQQS